MVKAVFFDLDGTVIDTNTLILESFRHTFRTRLHLDVPEETIYSFFGEPLHHSMSRFDGDVDDLLSTYRTFNLEHHDAMVRPFEGTEETLKELKGMGLLLGIITSKRRMLAERGLEFFRLRDYFDVVITPEDTQEHKPTAAPLLKACEVLGIEDPRETVMVGDSSFDLLCGKNAKAKTVGVSYSKISLDILEAAGPDFMVDSLREIPGLIRSGRL
ncbi:MAG TPA: pyrophosphatase PpaX [Clostridiaceae bacterium]|nr:pyrophosphatase PpaX [Clostridiaceae bacterium]